jgi:hypothetical protein
MGGCCGRGASRTDGERMSLSFTPFSLVLFVSSKVLKISDMGKKKRTDFQSLRHIETCGVNASWYAVVKRYVQPHAQCLGHALQLAHRYVFFTT